MLSEFIRTHSKLDPSIVSLFLVYLIISCTADLNTDNNSIASQNSSFDTKKVNINAEEIISEKISASSFIETVEFTELATSDSSQLSRIDKVIEYESRYYILDRITGRKLSVFNHQGNFLFQIGSIGKGPGEYIIPYDFSIDEASNQLYLLDIQNYRINVYDAFTGSFKKSLSHDIPATQLVRQGEKYIILGGDKGERLIVTDSEFNVLDRSIPFEPRYAVRVPDPITKISDSLTIFRLFLNDTIFGVYEGKLFPFMFIDFGKHAIRQSDFDFNLDQMEGMNYKERFASKMTNKTAFYYGVTHTFFTFIFQEDLHWAVKSNIDESKIVIPVRLIIDDVTYCYQPPYIKGISEDMSTFIGFISYDDLNLESMSELELLANSSELMRIINSGEFDENSNPILVKFRFNSNLNNIALN